MAPTYVWIRRFRRIVALQRLLVALVVAVLMTGPLLAVPDRAAAASGGVTTLTGSMFGLDPVALGLLPETQVVLVDLTAFVRRDRELTLPVTSQVMAGLIGDRGAGATYSVPLPIAPQGQANDVGHGRGGAGVQVYALEFRFNMVGDAYLGPFEHKGWSTALTAASSLVTNPDTGEATGGRIAIWAADDSQLFPTGFGADGKLFTADDPVGPVAAGWTVVDLDRKPFGRLRDAAVEVAIHPAAAYTDLSALSYSAAFDELVAELRRRYPFTAHKGIDWDELVAEIRPRIVQAERTGNAAAFNIALLRLSTMMRDGHVAVSLPADWLYANYSGGVGVFLGLTDDRRVTLRCVTPGLPADLAGIEAAAEIVAWNGEEPLAVLARTPQIFPASTDVGAELVRLGVMGRMKPGAEVTVEYRNPGRAETRSAKLVAVDDLAGLNVGPCGEARVDLFEMPVTVEVLPSGIGYIKINTFMDDVTLMSRAWEWAIQRLNALAVDAVIVDVRGNGGGMIPLGTYFAGSFTDQPLVLATEFVADERGVQIDIGELRIEPAPAQWTRPVAVLIDADCASACEIFAAAVARDPDHLIVGGAPSAGVEARVGSWLLPGYLSFQAPLVGFRHPDGAVFLEGVGVEPNVTVPNTPETLLVNTDDDAALEAAVAALRELAA